MAWTKGWRSHVCTGERGVLGKSKMEKEGWAGVMSEWLHESIAHLRVRVAVSLANGGWAMDDPVQGVENAPTEAPKRASSLWRDE